MAEMKDMGCLQERSLSALLALLLVLAAVGDLCAQPFSEPSGERWKQVFHSEGQDFSRPELSFSADGKLLASKSGRKIRAWDVVTGKEQADFEIPATLRFTVAGRDPGRQSLNTVWIAGKELPTLEGTDFTVGAIAFSADDKLMAVSGRRPFSNPREGSRVKVIDAASLKELAELPGDFSRSRLLAFSRDGKSLAVSGPNGVIKFWEVATKMERSQSPAIDGYSFALALQGKAVLAWTADGSGSLRLFDIDSGKLLSSFRLDGREIKTRFDALSGDGSILLLGGHENEPRGALGSATPIQVFRWWDLSTGRELGHFRGKLADGIAALALSPDGQRLGVASHRGALSLWVREKAPAER